ncbi:hypothetical protein PLESTM_001298400 [Pleodorina starrii]|nr:hypothetical protein PLESTM_001298400 [Pleodorina starrii]
MASVTGRTACIGDNALKRANRAASSAHKFQLTRSTGGSLRKYRVPFQQTPPTWQGRAIITPGESAQAEEAAKGLRSGAALAGNGSATGVTWKCSIRSTAPLLGDTGARLSIVIIDTYSELQSEVISLDSWKPPKEVARSDGTVGWLREGAITLPAELKDPGAVLVRKQAEKKGAESQDYIDSIQLLNASSVHTINVNSWVSSEQGWRVFFSGRAYLPKDTSPTLLDERQKELKDLQGTPETRLEERKGADRIYWYQVYNDLSSGQTGKLVRPTLGGSKELPYPRRLATNRGNEPDGREKPPAKGESIWLQLDDRFSFDKNVDFNGGALQSGLAAALGAIAELAGHRDRSIISLVPSLVVGAARELLGSLIPGSATKPLDNYEDFTDVLNMFKKASGPAFQSLLPTNLYPAASPSSSSSNGAAAATTAAAAFKKADGAWDFQLPEGVAAKIDASTADQRVGPVYDSATGAPVARSYYNFDSKPSTSRTEERLGGKLWGAVKATTTSINSLLFFNPPRVLDGRPDAWHTDEEYGRQAVAGFNPCTITALKDLPESFGSAIRAEHVNADLQGSTLEQLVDAAKKGAKPRLFMIDHWDMSAFWAEAEAGQTKDGKKSSVEHIGRAIFYLRHDGNGNDTGLIPVAIELAHTITHKANPSLPRTAGIVYSRAALSKDPATVAVWRLAKMIFKSVDSFFHQRN